MEKVKNFNVAFKTMRLIAVASFLGFIAATIIYVFKYQQVVADKESRVYIASDQGTFMARAGSEDEINPFEAKYLSEVFINNMFAHDAATYTTHTETALHLIDQPSGIMIAKAFEDGNIQNEYIRWGSRTTTQVDSIKILNASLPFEMVAYFRQQHWIGAEKKTELAIALKYNMVRTHRNEKNPFGLVISQLDFIPYPLEKIKK